MFIQFYIPKWADKAVFARDFRICEHIYGREVSDLDVDRAHARYLKLVK